jgi:1,4-dihydroxy-2-naphthoate octaprenyltransferase
LLGLPAAAVLAVNNYRDLEDDRRVGRKTFAVLFGRAASRAEYTVLMLLPFLMMPLMATSFSVWWWLPFVALPWAIILVRRFFSFAPGEEFNLLLANTAKFQLALSGLLGVAIIGGAGSVG